MDMEQLEKDVREGRISVELLLKLLRALGRELERLTLEIAELKKKLGVSQTPKTTEPYSLRAEEQRQQARQGKKPRRRPRSSRRGRLTAEAKIAAAVRREPCFPADAPPEKCWLSHTRPVWRLEQGRAVLVAYDIYRGPNSQYGKPPNVLGRSEFGLEILVAIAYQVYTVGLSYDKVCQLMGFFQQLPLKKSQVDASLHQLARHWSQEFERLCALLANSAVLHADETRWSLRSVWALLTEKARVLLYGVPKDAATLALLVDAEQFPGICISDNAAVYRKFNRVQKCWAHLLRKAIRLTLLAPDNAEYRNFTDRLYAIYLQARQAQQDGRLKEAGRTRRISELDDAIFDLCAPVWRAELPKSEGLEDDYRLLCNELMELMLGHALFTFVGAAPIDTPLGQSVPLANTNNEAERTLRSPALARNTGRGNKTSRGARRQTILVSVLESLRCYLPRYTLAAVIEEVSDWLARSCSRFERMCQALNLSRPPTLILSCLYPAVSV